MTKTVPSLTDEEAAVLREVLAHLVVQQRTGRIGVRHGLDRFVAIDLVLKKPQRLLLESAARKVGVAAIGIDKG